MKFSGQVTRMRITLCRQFTANHNFIHAKPLASIYKWLTALKAAHNLENIYSLPRNIRNIHKVHPTRWGNYVKIS